MSGAATGSRSRCRTALTSIQILLAITALGAAAAPLNPAYTRSEYVFYLTDIEPRFLLVPASRPEAATGAAQECSVPVLTVAGRRGRAARAFRSGKGP